jgi:uncharacterized protein
VSLTGANKRDCLEEHLVNFTGLLREEGLPLGTVELLDAVRALEKIDLSRRGSFKTALRATLVKSCRHRPVFDDLFDRYFVSEETRAGRLRDDALREEQHREQAREAGRELRFKDEPLRLSPEELLLYTTIPEEQRHRLLRFIRETELGHKVEPPFRPVLETVVKGQLRYWHDRLDREGPGPGGEGGGRAGGAPTGGDLRDVDIRDIREADLPRAEELLGRLSRQLAQTLFRRSRAASRRGSLDLRRSMRCNMRFGGGIFVLRYKRKHRPRQRLLLICDVSASMERYSSFVLQFIYGLQAAVRNLETFCFADNLEYISPALNEHGCLKQVLERVVVKSKTWGGGTSLSASLRSLYQFYQPLLDRKTTVIIVSDTKTTALDASLEALLRLKGLVRRVLWLNPLPPARWPGCRSVAAVAELIEMWPCSTIGQLEQVIAGRLLKVKAPIDKELSIK